jgi:hypothetical protein
MRVMCTGPCQCRTRLRATTLSSSLVRIGDNIVCCWLCTPTRRAQRSTAGARRSLSTCVCIQLHPHAMATKETATPAPCASCASSTLVINCAKGACTRFDCSAWTGMPHTGALWLAVRSNLSSSCAYVTRDASSTRALGVCRPRDRPRETTYAPATLTRSTAVFGKPNQVLVAVMFCNAADPETGEEVRGLCSNYIADVQPGDELVMTGPAGTALLLADNPWKKRIVCVSTGVCATPRRNSCAQQHYTVISAPFPLTSTPNACALRVPSTFTRCAQQPPAIMADVYSAAGVAVVAETAAHVPMRRLKACLLLVLYALCSRTLFGGC